MPNNLDSFSSESSSPKIQNQVPQFLYPILIVLVLLVIVVGAWYLYKNLNLNNKFTSTKPPSIDVAKSATSWVDGQKIQDDGSYHLNITCTDGNCVGSGDTFRVIPYIVWGKYQYFVKTGDQSVLPSIESDLDKLNGIQYGGWNCKLLYDLQEGSNLSSTLKDKAKAGCKYSGYEVFLSDQRFDPVFLESEIKANIKNILNGSLTKPSISDDQKNSLIDNFGRYSSYVSEVYYHNLWGLTLTTNPDLKNEAKQAFNQALKGYLVLNTDLIPKDPMLGISALDLYQFTNDKTYLDLANFIYNKNKNTKIIDISYLTYEYFFLRQLSKINNKNYLSDQNFKQGLSSVSSKFYNPVTKAFSSNNSYSIPDNALMIGIISNNE